MQPEQNTLCPTWVWPLVLYGSSGMSAHGFPGETPRKATRGPPVTLTLPSSTLRSHSSTPGAVTPQRSHASSSATGHPDHQPELSPGLEGLVLALEGCDVEPDGVHFEDWHYRHYFAFSTQMLSLMA